MGAGQVCVCVSVCARALRGAGAEARVWPGLRLGLRCSSRLLVASRRASHACLPAKAAALSHTSVPPPTHTRAEDHASAKFTYKMSPIQIVVTEQPKQLYKFLTAICAVIGGVFTVAGILDGMVRAWPGCPAAAPAPAPAPHRRSHRTGRLARNVPACLPWHAAALHQPINQPIKQTCLPAARPCRCTK